MYIEENDRQNLIMEIENQNKKVKHFYKLKLMDLEPIHKKPSKVDTVEFDGVPQTSVEYTDYTWDRSPTGAPKRTYNLSIDDHGHIMLFAGTPEIKQIGNEMGLVPTKEGSEYLGTMWSEGDLNSSIEKVKNFLRNPKIRVDYDGVIK